MKGEMQRNGGGVKTGEEKILWRLHMISRA